MTEMVTLVAPPLTGPISGGTAFNRALAAGTGARVVPSLEGVEGFAWVDTLFLSEASAHWERRPLGLLAHYLPSLVEHPQDLSASMLRPEEAAALAGARAILCPSAWMAQTLRDLGARGALRVLEPPLPPGVGVGPMPSGAPQLVVVGAVGPGKGQHALIEALARSPPRGSWSLDIIGSTEVVPAYADACVQAAAGLPIQFRGVLSPTSCLQQVGRAHGLVSASAMESYGMAIAEAQACGVPVLALARGNAGAMVARPGSLGVATIDALADAVRAHVEEPQRLLEPARATPRTTAPGWKGRATQALTAPD